MNDFSNICCVVFDLDETLWPCLPPIFKAEKILHAWLKQHYPLVAEHYSIEDLREHSADFAQRNSHLSHDVTAIRKQALEELANKFDYSVDMANEGVSLFRYHRNQVSLFDDALPTIRALREKYKVGSITNGNADLIAMGLGKYFDFIVTAEEAGVAKPDAAIFEHAQKKAELSNQELLYIGDDPVNDVMGSKNSGWQAIWFNPGREEWLGSFSGDVPEGVLDEELKEIGPDAQVQNLSELLGLLKM